MITEICDAVVAELNDHSFSLTFTAVRRYAPVSKLEDLATLKVSVLPSGWTREDATRSDIENTITVQIGLQQKIADDDTADDLVALAIEIVEFMQTAELSSYPDAQLISAACDPIYDPQLIDTHRVFISVIALTYMK